MRNIKTHHIKLASQYYNDVEQRLKNFEIRFNDRHYREGDWLVLKEWHEDSYTGRECVRQVMRVYELDAIGLKDWVAMSIN